MKISQHFLNALNDMPKHPSMSTRVIFLIVTVLVLLFLSLGITGVIIPDNAMQALIFQGSALLIVFGSLILEDKFTKPADAVINSFAVIISLTPVYSPQQPLWFLIFIYAVFVMILGIINLWLITDKPVGDMRARITKITYQLSTFFGKSELIFSAVFLYAVFSFYGLQSQETAILLIFWGIYICLLPLKIPHFLEALFTQSIISNQEGAIVRVDFPDLIKVRLNENSKWNSDLIAVLGDGIKRKVLPLYKQLQDATVIGTGLLLEQVESVNFKTIKGAVYRLNTEQKADDNLIGIVTIDSRIAKLHFETWKPQIFREGMLVYCEINTQKVYYQVSDAITNEEAFEKHRHGFQVIEAYQLGTYHQNGGFKKFSWLPEMNTPVYIAGRNIQGEKLKLTNSQMSLGIIPETDIEIVCNIDDIISHHTAILGVTGAGKTELALKIIKQATENGVKVFCVDITGQYIHKLTSLIPRELSIEKTTSDSLAEKLFNVESGEYAGQKEKRPLKEFSDKIREDIKAKIKEFLDSSDMVGIFTMPSISNTKATIFATEIYLSSIFEYSRTTVEDRKKVLIVLEEAHTVIPESNMIGLGDNDSKAMVAKISQIALQGRKYDVGLLVIAQRTANISKTVLTQCNTMITFTTFDQTGVEFLSNIYGRDHTSKISNLPFLQALVFGKGIKSEHPVVIEMHRNSESKME